MQTSAALRAVFVLTLATAAQRSRFYNYQLCSFENHACETISSVCVTREDAAPQNEGDDERYFCQCLVSAIGVDMRCIRSS